jgi:predicted metal-dependent hydrolase
VTALAVSYTDTELYPRRVSFDWSQLPLHWVADDPTTTHTINVLHLLLPAGERWFVHIYKQALPLVDDPKLKAEVKGFMGQEAVHARAHSAVLEHLAAHGVDARPFASRVDWMFNSLGGDDRLRGPFARWWLLERVAIIAAIEHFTAVLGYWVLNSPALDAAGSDPTMLDLLRWHGAEEVEHRSVAFDVSRALKPSRLARIRAMLIVAPTMLYLFWRGARYLCRIDPTYSGPLPTLRSYRHAAKRGLLPTQGSLLRAVPRYCRRDYHPSQEADTAAAVRYLAASPAAIAATAARRGQ